jgi:D-xylose transport system substrate-binding protein
MQQAITAMGNNGFIGAYAANDGTAGGAIAAMNAAGIDPAKRPTTGQDAELMPSSGSWWGSST